MPAEVHTERPGGLPEDVLFVFGPARGGTTFLTDILYGVFGYSMGPEGNFVPGVLLRARSLGDLRQDDNLQRFLTSLLDVEMLRIMRRRWPAEKRIDITYDDLLRNLPERSAAGGVYAVLAAVREARGKARIGIKNPGYWQCLDVLDEGFGPRGRYLCIMRDGRDVALSNYQVSWGQRNAWACATTWLQLCTALGAFARRVGPDRLLVIRYEDLLDDPPATLDRISSFLGVAADGPAREQLVAELAASRLRQNHGKWRQQMSADDIRIYEAVAGDQLRQHGYETMHPDARLSFSDRLSGWLGETLRKVRRTLSPPPRR